MTKECLLSTDDAFDPDLTEAPLAGGLMRRNRGKLAVAAALVIVVAAAVLWPRDFAVRQTARESFTLDLPFEQVRRILVLTEATSDILTSGDAGDLKEYTWIKRPDVLQLLRGLTSELNLQAKATLKVQTVNEDYVGSHLITLNQDVDIRNDCLNSAILLDKGTGRLHDYQNITRFSPDGKRTRVETSVTLGILVTAPNVARSYATGRVRASAERKVASQVSAIRQVIDANKEKPLLSLPFGG